jgi:hypothetical protein
MEHGQRGCYIVDTATGELWHHVTGQRLERIADKLPPTPRAREGAARNN